MRLEGLEKGMMLACREGRRMRGRSRRRWRDEIHEVTGMKLAEQRDMTTERKQRRRLAMMVAKFQELTAQGDKMSFYSPDGY